MSLPALMVQCSLFSALGTALTHFLITKPKIIPYVSYLSMLTFQAFLFAPFAFLWYPFLVSLFPGNDALHIVMRIALDQSLGSFCIHCTFHFYLALIATMDIAQSFAAVRKQLFGSLSAAWIYWIPIQTINNIMVSEENTVLMLNIAAVPWSMYLSWLVNQNALDAKASKTEVGQKDGSLKKKRKKKSKKER